MQSPKNEKRKNTQSPGQTQETVLLRYPLPKYNFEGKKLPKAGTPKENRQSLETDVYTQQRVEKNALSSRSKSGQKRTDAESNKATVVASKPSAADEGQKGVGIPRTSGSLLPSGVRASEVQPSALGQSNLTSSSGQSNFGVFQPVSLPSKQLQSNSPGVLRAGSTGQVTFPSASKSSFGLTGGQTSVTKVSSKPVSVVDPLHPNSGKGNSKVGLQEQISKPEILLPSSKSSVPEDSLRPQVERLRIENESLRGQLDVQLQVNRELKKLLVASVGEDLATRVELLARDKAEMSLELGGFSKKMTEDYENLDKISIEADMWRSKYLASKVMVDELASSRAFFALQFQESQESLQELLNERHELRANLIEVYKCLQQVKSAFDPLNSQQSPPSLQSTNVLSLVKTTQQLAEMIRFRLLPGQSSVHTVINIEDNWQDNMTQAEAFANELLARKLTEEDVKPSHPGASRVRLKIDRYHPHVRFDNLTINCCTHCKGEINVL